MFCRLNFTRNPPVKLNVNAFNMIYVGRVGQPLHFLPAAFKIEASTRGQTPVWVDKSKHYFYSETLRWLRWFCGILDLMRDRFNAQNSDIDVFKPDCRYHSHRQSHGVAFLCRKKWNKTPSGRRKRTTWANVAMLVAVQTLDANLTSTLCGSDLSVSYIYK